MQGLKPSQIFHGQSSHGDRAVRRVNGIAVLVLAVGTQLHNVLGRLAWRLRQSLRRLRASWLGQILGRRRCRAGLFQCGLLLDRDAIENRAVFVDEAVHRFNALVVAFEVVIHVLHRLFMQHLAAGGFKMLRRAELFLNSRRIDEKEECLPDRLA